MQISKNRHEKEKNKLNELNNVPEIIGEVRKWIVLSHCRRALSKANSASSPETPSPLVGEGRGEGD